MENPAQNHPSVSTCVPHRAKKDTGMDTGKRRTLTVRFRSSNFAVKKAGPSFEDDVLDQIDQRRTNECAQDDCGQIHSDAVHRVKEIELVDHEIVQHYHFKRDLAEELDDGIADLHARHEGDDKDQEDKFEQGLLAESRKLVEDRVGSIVIFRPVDGFRNQVLVDMIHDNEKDR